MTQSHYSPTLNRIALLTAVATFPLIFMGGLVTSHGAGMSVPDWPNSYGYNMFTFPPSKWVGGILYEHTHRLMGTVVGMCSIALVIAAWKLESRSWVRSLATATLLAVIVQGVLGGLRVNLVNLTFAMVHACFGQMVFCMTALMVIVTSRWWFKHSSTLTDAPSRMTLALSAACVFACFAQLIVGAVMRHEKAGLAIPDLPLAYGKLLPPANIDHINQVRAWELDLDPVTLEQVWLAFAHRLGAIVVSAAIGSIVVQIVRHHRDNMRLLLPALALLVLLISQTTLGVLTVLLRKPADIASAHVAVGALVLATSFVITVRLIRLAHLQPIRAAKPVTDAVPAMELVPA